MKWGGVFEGVRNGYPLGRNTPLRHCLVLPGCRCFCLPAAFHLRSPHPPVLARFSSSIVPSVSSLLTAVSREPSANEFILLRHCSTYPTLPTEDSRKKYSAP